VYLQEQGDGKYILTTVVTKEALGLDDIPPQAIVTGMVMRNPYTGFNASLQLNREQIMPVDDYVKTVMQSNFSCKGMGLNGIMTALMWFCQKVKDPFHGLLG
jgi:hypothetical protein